MTVASRVTAETWLDLRSLIAAEEAKDEPFSLCEETGAERPTALLLRLRLTVRVCVRRTQGRSLRTTEQKGHSP